MAEDYPGVYSVTAENVAAFARRRGAEVAEAQRLTAVEPVRAGDFVGVCYLRRGEDRDGARRRVVDRWFLETVVAGRMYTFELRALPDESAAHRPHLMAVAAGAVFAEQEAAQPVAAATDGRAIEDGGGAAGSREGTGEASGIEAGEEPLEREEAVVVERPAPPRRRWQGEAELELIDEVP